MGFRPKLKHIVLTFPGDEDLEGLEAVMRRKNLGEYLDLIGLTDGGIDGPVLVRQLEAFGESLVSWNWEDPETGKPVPATKEAVFQQDQQLMLRVATAWIERLDGKVEAPLPQSSPAGEPSPAELALPMAPLSDHPAPTSMPA